MDLLILLLLFPWTSALAASPNRRQSTSYTSNVVHKDLRYPDQYAQSTIQFQIGSNQHLNSKIVPYTTPKSVQDYRQEVQLGSPKPGNELRAYQAQRSLYQGPRFEGQVQKLEGQVQKFEGQGQRFEGQSQSQSFNVGYSVKFGGPQKGNKPKYESDVITGSYKEEVVNPFVRSPNLDDARGKVTQQAYLTPTTNLNNFQKASPWRTLSPTVEIYKSKEVQSFDGYKKGFDHSKALGKSEGFDYTNAVDFKPYQPKVQFGQAVQNQQVYTASPKVIPKLPIDTSLIRDPVLTTNKQVQISSKHIPIHFDTSLIQQMAKTNLDQSYIPFQAHFDYTGQSKPAVALPLVQQVQKEFNNIQPEQSKNVYHVSFGYPQNGLFDPQALTRSSPSKSNLYSVNETVEDSQQPEQTQFKVFGKPQNNFMRHEYEKSKSRFRLHTPKRMVRHWDMEMDLRPPPLVYSRRRVYV